MYDTILMTVDNSPTDRAIVDHIKPLAKLCGSHVVVFHVADGYAARTFAQDAVSPEISEDTAYLDALRDELRADGINADAEMAYGEPVPEIIRWVQEHDCDLVAMSTHGHRFVADWIYGSTADKVQHCVSVPVLMLRACKEQGGHGEAKVKKGE